MKGMLMFRLLGKFLGWISAKSLEVNYHSKIDDLKKRGLKVGKNVIISPAARIDDNYPYLISIGKNSVIGPNVRLLAHDSTFSPLLNGKMRVGRISIGDNVIIGMNSLVMPNVVIGSNVLVASGSLVNKDIAPNSCVAGVPARFYAKFDDYIKGIKEEIKVRPLFEAVDLKKNEDEKDKDRKKKMIKATEDGFVYINGMETKYPIWLPRD